MLLLHFLHLDFEVVNTFITFGNLLMQIFVGSLQFFQLSTSEKKTDTTCYGSGRIGGYAFEFVGAYFRFYLFEFLLGKAYLLFLVSLGFLYTL